MKRRVYLKRDPKTGVYKYRREYPADVRQAFGKATFICSLQTKELKKANEASAKAEKAFEALIENTRVEAGFH